MKREAAKALCLAKMREFGLTHDKGWTFAFNRAKMAAGQCRWYRGQRGGEIRLSGPVVDLNDEPAILDTILHEIAHALAGREAGHGPLWQSICRRIGAKPTRCVTSDQIVAPARSWHGSCPICGGKARPRHRKPRKRLVCGVCYRDAKRDNPGLLVQIPAIEWYKEVV